MESTSKLAELYQKNSTSQGDQNKELLKILEVPAGALVLDLGCGTGELAAILSELVGPGGRVVAVDPDVQRIKLAKKTHSRPNIEFLVADDKSFPGEGYDLMIAASVIHWIEDKEGLLERVRERLAPDGKFAFVTLNGRQGLSLPPATKMAFHELFPKDFEEKVVFTKWMYKNVTEYAELAKSHQLQVSSVKTMFKEVKWKNVDAFIDFWVAALPGEIEPNSIDQQKLENFTLYHEKELIANPVLLDIALLVLSK